MTTSGMLRTLRLLNDYAAVARPIMRTHWRADSCIAAVRVTIDVLRYYGLDVEPLAVQLIAANGPWRRMMRETGEIAPQSVEAVEYWRAAGAHSVVVGMGVDKRHERPDGTGIDLHLVSIVTGPGLESPRMVDAAVDQVARPAKGITPPEVIIGKLPPKFLTDAGMGAGLDIPGEGRLFYRRHPDPPRWETAPDWNRSHGAVTLPIVRALAARGVTRPQPV